MTSSVTLYIMGEHPRIRELIHPPHFDKNIQIRPVAKTDHLLDAVATSGRGCVVWVTPSVDSEHLEAIGNLKQLHGDLAVIVCAKEVNVQSCIGAFRAGADDFLQDPIDDVELRDRLRVAIGKLERKHTRSSDAANLESPARTPDPEVQQRLERLTPRERDVIDLLMEGKVTKQVASELEISFQTAAKHRARIHRKMKVASDAELVRLLLTRGSWDADSSTHPATT